MKELLIVLGTGYLLFQFTFVVALLAAARKPAPQFSASQTGVGPGHKELELAA